MKKIVLAGVVLAVVFGVSNTTNAFWGFSKKANKAEVKSEQAENNMAAAAQYAFKGESKDVKLAINKEGSNMKAIAGGAKIKTLPNTDGVLTAEVAFGTGSVFNFNIKTDTNTKVYRHYQGENQKESQVISSLSDIKVNDIVSVEGVLDLTVSDGFTITASKIKDYSMQGKDVNYTGTIDGDPIDASSTFTLAVSGTGNVTVIASEATKIFIDGKQKAFVDLDRGMFVTSAKGIANTNVKTLAVREIRVDTRHSSKDGMMYQSAGNVVSVNADNKTLQVNIAGINYSVVIGVKMSGEDVKDKSGWTFPRGFYEWMLVGEVKKSVPTDWTTIAPKLTAGTKVWLTGEVKRIKSNQIQVDAYRIEKSSLGNQ